MKYKEVSFSETFPLPSGHYQKIFVTAELEGSDDPRQALYEVKKVVQNFFYESNKAAEKQLQEENGSQVGLIPQIQACTDINVLKSFELLAKKDPEAHKIYLKQLKTLQQ